MTPRTRPTLDVAHLPEVVFGAKSVSWWGTVMFILIEGTTLAVCAATYLYLRTDAAAWPPEHVPLPSLLVPTISTLVLLAVVVPLRRVGQAARRLDRAGVARWLVIGTLLSIVATALRLWEFGALNVRWDQNAYGSAAWATLGFHSALLLMDLLETGVMALIFLVGPVEEKHYSDAEDAALYQYFLSLSYVPLYVLVFLSPRWM